MINTGKYDKLLSSGLNLDHYFLLVCIYNGEELPKNKRITGFINLLTKKGYIEEGALTEKAFDFVDEVASITTTTTTIAPKQDVNFNTWVKELHKKLEDRIYALKGKKQVRDTIKGKAHSFLCNDRDLGHNLGKVIKLYKLTDLNLIERRLLQHINDCNKANNWFPIMYYYIMKDNKSPLVTDMQSINEKEEQDSNNSNAGGEIYI